LPNHFLSLSDRKQIKRLIEESDPNNDYIFQFLEEKYMESLKPLKKNFSQIFNSTPAGILISDLNGVIIDCNKQMKEITGYERSYFIGKKFLKLGIYHSNGLEILKNEYKRFLEKGHTNPSEFQIEKRNGKKIWISLAAEFINYNGIQAIQGVIFDITDRKKREKRLKELSTITEKTTDAIIKTDLEFHITYINPAAEELFGWKLEEVTGKRPGMFSAEPNKEMIEQEIYDTVSSGNVYEGVLLNKKKDGTKFYNECKVSPLINKKGEIYSYISSQRDVTERVKSQKRLKESEKELKRLNKLKSQLLRRTSHELKTPLISIKGFANLLLKQQSHSLNKKALEYIKEIKNGCERLENLIKKILDAAKIETNKINVVKQENDLANLVKKAVNALRGALKEREHSINLNLHDKMMIKGDEEKLLEVIENLLSNAIKYTPREGKISISSEIKEDKFVISIKDNGIGFTPDEKDDIFVQFGKIERFGGGYDVDSEGSGLGLYISKRLIEVHGGSLWMESEGRNKGSTFYFSIPKSKT